MIFSVGFVFSEDINQTNDNMEVADTDVISTQDVGTYTDLSQKIEAKTNLDKDYAFNENDTIKKIAINDKINKNYVINGNNHTIDGDNKVGVFSFTNVAVTINDLTIKNCGESAILVENSTLILNNVNFIDNHDNISGAAIYGYESDIRTNNCLFKDNYAPEGSAIYVKQSDLTTGQTTFTNKNPIHWALIYGTNSLLNIENTLFENVSSMYATAIYTEMSKTNVIRSKFSNLYANATAGAIGVKTLFTFILQDCTFTNVSSVKNGGAVYVDVNGPGDKNGGVLINHTLFDHCSSNYGGAVLQLGGKINIIYSNFTNNRASFSGGAVYTSNSTFYVGESDFINNNIIYKDSEIGNGGALFLDYGSQEIEYCNFIKNSANAGGGVYCATKAAVKAITDGLRIDVAESAVRVTNVKPGLVETNFSVTRFHGDAKRAEGVYQGIQPLTGDDIADVAFYAASAPEHVQIAEVLVLATHQASGSVIHRDPNRKENLS